MSYVSVKTLEAIQNKPITVLFPGKIGSYFHFYFGFYSVVKREVRRKWKHSDSSSFESHPRTLLTMYTVWISLHSKRLVGSQFEAWAKELPRFAALWLGRKTQTLSGTSQKPGRPQPSGTGLVKQCSQELMLENFCRAFSSDPTHCPWISDNDFTAEYDYIDSLCTAVPSPQAKSRRETTVSHRLSPRLFFRGGADVHRLLHWLTNLLFSLKFDKLLTTQRGLHQTWRLMQNVVKLIKRPFHDFFFQVLIMTSWRISIDAAG